MEFSILEDRIPTIYLEGRIAEALRRLGVTKKTNTTERVHFCGVIVSQEQVFVLAPRNSGKSKLLGRLPNSQLAALILRVLAKYNTFSTTAIGVGAEPEDGNEGLGILASILWLLNDYATHGLYTTSMRSRQVNSGKVNWNRTISRETPHSGVGGSPVYMRLHSERIKFGEQSPVTLVHAEVIKELDRAFCWVVSGDAAIRIGMELELMPEVFQHVNTQTYLLKRELASTYADREIRLLKTLIKYLESKTQRADGEYIIGVRGFQTVWEAMLRDTIPNVIIVNPSLPKPHLYMKGRGEPVQARGMQTDIVSKNLNTLSIIDAKYYRAETPGDSPGWPDIVKQLYYLKALRQICPDSKLTNWFVFPGDQPENNQGPISSIAVIDNSGTPLTEEFQPIGCLYFCPIDVMQRYAASRKYAVSEISALYGDAVILD